jgi:carbon dioxide concentrating mechanism protein CcmM
VTFHALARTSITIGTGLDTDDNVVFHGPLTVGYDLTIADDAVLFRSNVGNNVTIGDGALVIGPADAPLQILNGKVIPPNALIPTQAQLNALP